MSPDDPRYGAPMNPHVIYSDRGNPGQAQPGYDNNGAGNGGVRPPGAIDGGQTAAIQPQGAAPIGSDGHPTSLSALPPDDQPETGPAPQLPERLRRQEVNFTTKEPPGTIVVDTANTQLYYVLGHGRAIRYGVRVGRDGFTWTGVQKITRKAEWPDWHPPAEMIERQPYLPRFMAGGDGNPLGARAMYLGSTVYRIHGTNQPSTIGKFVSSGCIGMLNEDVIDLFDRAKVGTRVVVLPGTKPAEPATASVQPASTPTTSGAAYGQQQSAYGQQQSNVAMGVPNQGPTQVPPLPAPVTIR
jgi:lipoprotein-anchoring transpeptidase ErfK/SrfK